jgi:hypothetical protein
MAKKLKVRQGGCAAATTRNQPKAKAEPAAPTTASSRGAASSSGRHDAYDDDEARAVSRMLQSALAHINGKEDDLDRLLETVCLTQVLERKDTPEQAQFDGRVKRLIDIADHGDFPESILSLHQALASAMKTFLEESVAPARLLGPLLVIGMAARIMWGLPDDVMTTGYSDRVRAMLRQRLAPFLGAELHPQDIIRIACFNDFSSFIIDKFQEEQGEVQRGDAPPPTASFTPFMGEGMRLGSPPAASSPSVEDNQHKLDIQCKLEQLFNEFKTEQEKLQGLLEHGDRLTVLMQEHIATADKSQRKSDAKLDKVDALYMPIIFRSSFGELTDQQWQGLTEHVVGEMQEWAQDEGNSLALGYLKRGGESSSESSSDEKLKQEAVKCLDALCDKDLETLQQELARRGLLQRSSETADNSQLELTRTAAVDMLCRVREENAALKNVIEAQNGEINQLKTETAELQRTVVSLAKRLG